MATPWGRRRQALQLRYSCAFSPASGYISLAVTGATAFFSTAPEQVRAAPAHDDGPELIHSCTGCSCRCRSGCGPHFQPSELDGIECVSELGSGSFRQSRLPASMHCCRSARGPGRGRRVGRDGLGTQGAIRGWVSCHVHCMSDAAPLNGKRGCCTAEGGAPYPCAGLGQLPFALTLSACVWVVCARARSIAYPALDAANEWLHFARRASSPPAAA